MDEIKQQLIKEHADLTVKIENLSDYIYSDKSDKDDKVEFANKCIQLGAMKKYAEALLARMNNQGIDFNNGTYTIRVATIARVIPAEGRKGEDNV